MAASLACSRGTPFHSSRSRRNAMSIGPRDGELAGASAHAPPDRLEVGAAVWQAKLEVPLPIDARRRS